MRSPRNIFLALSTTSTNVDDLVSQIKEKGDQIRALKDSKADKSQITSFVDNLLELKAEYEKVTGSPYDPPSSIKTAKQTKVSTSSKEVKSTNVKKLEDRENIVITPRSVDYSAWYNDVITGADLVDQSPVRGCMVIKPWGMGVWDILHADLDSRIRDSGTQNAYFPLFIPKSFLAKEAEHVEGFAKECAVVTHHRLCVSPDGKDLIPGEISSYDRRNYTQ